MKKPTPGKYVLRSTYQRIAEENKKLLRDIKILTGPITNERIRIATEWKDKFQKQEMTSKIIKHYLETMLSQNKLSNN